MEPSLKTSSMVMGMKCFQMVIVIVVSIKMVVFMARVNIIGVMVHTMMDTSRMVIVMEMANGSPVRKEVTNMLASIKRIRKMVQEDTIGRMDAYTRDSSFKI